MYYRFHRARSGRHHSGRRNWSLPWDIWPLIPTNKGTLEGEIRFFLFAFDRRSFHKQGPLTVCGCTGWVTACSSSESDMSITLSMCGCIRPIASPWTRMTRFPARRGKVEVVAEAKRIRPKAEFRLEGWYIEPDWFV